ncbi:MAG: hypothetical protein K5764_02415 [Prevotella sp.]|nr:hypothetical protein [Prevotella sp.]
MRYKVLLLSVLLALPFCAEAQRLAEKGRSVKDLVPAGWEVKEARGDLNKDSVADLVIIGLPNDEEGLLRRDDGYVFNLNQPVLAIYFGNADGSFTRCREYGRVLLPSPDEYLSITHSPSITPRGAIVLSVKTFASAGGWSNNAYSYTYRYQNGDFYLIGKEEDSAARNTGKGEKVSYNYLTHKCQRLTYNLFDEDKPVERWSKIPAKPLEKLGQWSIPYEEPLR